jgi:hypothetical protein
MIRTNGRVYQEVLAVLGGWHAFTPAAAGKLRG